MAKLRAHGKRSALLGLTAVAASAVILAAGAASIFGSSSHTTAVWRLLPPAPIEVDAGLASVWTGEELIVSGVTAAPDGTFIDAAEVAAAYRPATNSWRRLASPPKTDNYCRRSAVWTGEEMLVWGCGHVAFDPETNRWRRLPPAPVGAPGLAIWTGRALIGWGGGCCGDASADGAAFDPTTDTWRKLAPSPLAASQGPVGAWTGRELIILVSGFDPDGKRIAGASRAAAYIPATDTWRQLAPPPGRPAAALWDGRELLIVAADAVHAYDDVHNRWGSLAEHAADLSRPTTAWTGREWLLFGGQADLFAYDPVHDRSSRYPSAPLTLRSAPTVNWTERELIVWDGETGAAFTPSSQDADGGGQS
jgi:hypothetical protein